MRSKRIGVGFLLCSVILLVGAGEVYSVRRFPLKLKLKEGEQYYFHMVNDQKISQKTGKRTTKSHERYEIGMIVNVNSIDSAGNMVVDCNYVHLMMTKGAGKKRIEYDSSKKKPVPKAARNFSMLLGETFSMQLTPLGKVKELRGLKKMKGRIAKKFPAGTSLVAATRGLGKYLEAGELRQWIEYMLAIYPGKISDVDDTWKRETKTLSPYPIMTKDTFRLKDRKRRNVTIEFKSKIKPNVDAKPNKMGFATTSYEFNGTQEGLIELKETSGLIKKSTLKKRLSGVMKMVISLGGGEPKEVIRPIEFEEVTTLAMGRIEIEEPDEDDLEDAAKKKE